MDALHFVFPWDGDVLNSRDGAWEKGALWVKVGVDREAEINGVKAVYCEERKCFVACIPLYGYRNCVIAKADGEEARLTLFALRDEALLGFRVSSDDNIIFLQELTEGNYASIFDHPYLAVYKKAHDRYGATAHLNLFYSFDDRARSFFAKKREYFDLSMMTDRYKEEFRANASWLKLAFHAKSEFPDRPYRHADGKTVREDCIAVCREICRFAGAECISNSTTVHWGEANREGVRALRALGFRSLTGYFERDKQGEPLVSYYADLPTVDHVGARDFWVDTKEDMIFGRIDRVLNVGSLEEVLSDVRAAAEDPHRGGFVSVMIHEQYFYEDYRSYLPDFERRVLESCRILKEKGYEGRLISDTVAEPPLNAYGAF